MAKARTDGKLSYVVVDPVLTHADNRASGDRGRWLPIKPGTDGALAMAIIRWLFENERIDSHFLSFPNAALAKQNGEPSFSNASHLVVVEPKHPREPFRGGAQIARLTLSRFRLRMLPVHTRSVHRDRHRSGLNERAPGRRAWHRLRCRDSAGFRFRHQPQVHPAGLQYVFNAGIR